MVLGRYSSSEEFLQNDKDIIYIELLKKTKPDNPHPKQNPRNPLKVKL